MHTKYISLSDTDEANGRQDPIVERDKIFAPSLSSLTSMWIPALGEF